MFDQSPFGHFGAPQVLRANYGVQEPVFNPQQQQAPQSSQQSSGFDPWSAYQVDPLFQQDPQPQQSTPQQPPQWYEQKPSTGNGNGNGNGAYVRGGKVLPNLRGGATDAMVKEATGIQGLVSEVERRMGLKPSGTLPDKDIKTYQTSKGLKDDGILGEKTYAKLGFEPPYKRSGGGGYSTPTKEDSIGKDPFYKKKWFLWTSIGLVVVATGVVLFYPREED